MNIPPLAPVMPSPVNPLPTVPASVSAEAPSPPSAGRAESVEAVTWSPTLWWLLQRYEYLFEGLLPRLPDPQVRSGPSEPSDPLGRPHWGDDVLLNPPPTLAGPASAMEAFSFATMTAESPVPRGTFVDVVV